MQDWAKAFYHSSAWRAVRGYALYRDQMLCQDCLKKGLYTPAREVHHIIELTPDNITDPEIALNPDNLISLCRKCHYERHNTESKKRYTIDEATGKVTPK